MHISNNLMLLRKITFRSFYRGTKESDHFVNEFIIRFLERDNFVFLEISDSDLIKWVFHNVVPYDIRYVSFSFREDFLFYFGSRLGKSNQDIF